MKAAVTSLYGSPDIIQLLDVPRPVPADNDVLVKIHATTVSRTDCGMLCGTPKFARIFIGFPKPRTTILGMEFAGVVESVGNSVTSFKPGDRVFGMSAFKYGAHAEYICVTENAAIAKIPENMSFQETLVCEGVWYADGILKKFDLNSKHKILIYGASGAIGIAALQLAKSYGADVTAIVATRHLDLARSLGADRVVDYTAEDFTQIEGQFDFVLDAVGKTTFGQYKNLLKPGGTFSATDLGPGGQNAFLAIWSMIGRNKRVIFPIPALGDGFIHFVQSQLEAGKFRAVIDKIFTLDQIAEAYRYVLTEQKTGIVAIDIPHD